MISKINKLIDRRSKTPYDKQIYNILSRSILENEFAVGTVIGSITEISESLKINATFVESAFENLERENLVFKDQDLFKCKFNAVPTILFEQISDFRFIIESRGMEYRVNDSEVYLTVDKSGVEWIHLHRQFFGDNKCLIVADSKFNAAFFKSLKNKTKEDTRQYAAYYDENGITSYNTFLKIRHINLPLQLSGEMNQAPNITCSNSTYKVMCHGKTINESNFYTVGFGFRFTFPTKLLSEE